MGEIAQRTVTMQLDVPARMRDGVTLRANVYRPEGDGPWPVLLTRTPYGKDATEAASWLDPLRAVRAGFIVVVQDTRGRFASDGEWEPFRYESEDGYDTVEWAARLPGSNGRVGMFGASYLGNTQWTAAIEQPPSLAAIAPSLTWSDPLEGLFARGGAVELGVTLPWALGTGAAHLARLSLSEAERARRLQTLFDDFDGLIDDGYWDLPVNDTAVMRRNDVPELGGIRALADRSVAEWCAIAGRHDRVTVPSLHVAGWHDNLTQGVLDSYLAMAALGRPARLVVGPWTHLTFADAIGEQCFGIRSSRLGPPAHPEGDLDDVHIAWFRRYLDPGAACAAQTAEAPPVRIFVMGHNQWRDEQAWPLARAREQRWHLHADGTLAPDLPGADAAPTTFLYDPADPVPTVGGNHVLVPAYPPGPYDQARVEARPDVLVFTSEPLQYELEVTGRVRVVLHAASSAPSTDWVARLCDVHPDGRSYNVCDGIIRIADGADELQRIAIDLWSTSNAFLAGHRVRVHVTSSNFPRWDRNLNTGRQDEPRFETAHQTIHHDAARASWIELPVIG